MPGISLLRPQYTRLGNAATRLAPGARQVAHETNLNAISGVSESRANGRQDDVILQEVMVQPPDQHSRREDGQPEERERAAPPPAAAAASHEPAGAFHVDPHLPPAERMAPTGLVVAAPLPMSELLRAAEQAYGYSREVAEGAVKPGGQLDAAS